MSWQEELRELDTALADGHISAAEYRRASEDLIAAASAPTAAETPRLRPPGHRTVKAQETPDAAAESKRRQPPAPPSQPQVPPPAETFPPVAPRPRTPPQDGPGPAARGYDPVDAAFGQQPRPTHGRLRGHWRAFGALACVLVLLGVGAIVVWRLMPVTPAARHVAGAPAATVPAPVGARLDQLPGRRVSSTDTVGIDKLAGLDMISQRRTSALLASGIPDALYLTSIDGPLSFSLVVIGQHDERQAVTTTRDALATGRERGMRAVDASSATINLPATVTLLTSSTDSRTTLRAAYTSHRYTVVIDGGGKPGKDTTAGLSPKFTALARTITAVLPPG